MSPDPSGLSYADPTNAQSLNLYSYAQNNPLTNTDPTGLDCVYFNDAGNGVESVDRNSSSGECGSTGETMSGEQSDRAAAAISLTAAVAVAGVINVQDYANLGTMGNCP